MTKATGLDIGTVRDIMQELKSEPAVVLEMGDKIAGPHEIGHMEQVVSHHEMPAQRTGYATLTQSLRIMMRIPQTDKQLPAHWIPAQFTDDPEDLLIDGKPLAVGIGEQKRLIAYFSMALSPLTRGNALL